MNCHKCNGTGEAFGGVCYDCNGKGSVNEVRYQTVSAKESHHPALVAEKNTQPDPFVPPDPKHVEMLLDKMRAMFELPAPEVVVEVVDQVNCQHEFTTKYYVPQCSMCGLFEAQFEDDVATQLEYTRTEDEKSNGNPA